MREGTRSARKRRRATVTASLLCAFALALLASVALAAAGALDTSFSGDGRRTFGFNNGPNSDDARGVAIAPDGKVVTAGVTAENAPDYHFGVARLRPGGGLDPSFSDDGRRTVGFANGGSGDIAYDVAVRASGKIVVVGDSGQSGTGTDFGIAQLTPTGGLDQVFSGDGRRTVAFSEGADSDRPRGVAIQRDGKLVVAGASQGVTSNFAITRLNPDGSLDQSFSGNGKREFGFPGGWLHSFGEALKILPDGRIVVAGEACNNETCIAAVARLNADGSFDQGFSGDGRRTFGYPGGTAASGVDVAIRSGKIVVAGTSNQGPAANDFAVARFNPNGTFDQSFSGDGRRTFGFATGGSVDVADALGLDSSGKIVVAGSSDLGGTHTDFAVARLNPGGSFDQGFASGGKRTFGFDNAGNFDGANDVAIHANDKIVVAGGSSQAGSGSDVAVARLLGN